MANSPLSTGTTLTDSWAKVSGPNTVESVAPIIQPDDGYGQCLPIGCLLVEQGQAVDAAVGQPVVQQPMPSLSSWEALPEAGQDVGPIAAGPAEKIGEMKN